MARLNRKRRTEPRTRVIRKKYKYTKLIFVNMLLIAHLYATQYNLYELAKQLMEK